jgi:uncharacterized protein YodC (DUF2158 family)
MDHDTFEPVLAGHADFPRGATVRLRSGGPNMTVVGRCRTGASGRRLIKAVWVGADGKMHTAKLPPEALAVVTPVRTV